ncbi:hypothetical protein OEZ86_005581 [Tetradesmus obliquus]|uniref:Glycoside hydrolase family 5 domain-containing protein n=1 Tax=Tetradesmus obliquus TaxID=3088 RepID=A0ABY8UEY7_TETOB|nr:hypothetical protein OEZ85_003852 [Tetradesmus obliquus]WIA39483.1 hypothetical protein OEZ86_005581 [Tetradesmus obliquus]
MPPRGTPPPPLKLVGHRLVNARNNKVVSLRGLNWFGFNVGMGMVDGLWAGGTAAATDFALITYQLRLLGYNAVRLPFTWKDLNMDPRSFDKDCSPVTVDWLRRRLISPHVVDKYANRPLPGNVAPVKNTKAGYCNTYLPQSSGWDRLLYATQTFISQGMYVVLDYQPMGLEQHAYDLNLFVDTWAQLWRQVSCLPNFQRDLANRVFVDVMNEPDSMNIRWEARDGRPGAQQLYLGVADALWALSPAKVLFMFEGTGQNMFGLNWGNGFITDYNIINSRGLSDPNPFFATLVRKPYADKSVITPHVYPPSITMATFLGTSLWEQCRVSFGYLQSEGYCSPERCTRFPIVIGEVGSAFETATDKQWLQDFADFVNAEGGAKAYNTIPVNGWLWWAYNENSGDTGGIVHNRWQDLHWEKINWMIARMGLRPWYLR